MAMWLAVLVSAWLLVVLLMALRYRTLLVALWREPVLRRPVLIIESDDWGAGPESQVEALKALAQVLSKVHDHQGRYPVMTLGLILASADGRAMAAQNTLEYRRRQLNDPSYAALRQVIADGVAQGVFSLQLHGMEHYWPDALMKAAKGDDNVRQWLTGDCVSTEALPSHLQSRWVDGSELPSVKIAGEQAFAAVNEEVATYRALFASGAAVVVPRTFVWNLDVERAWAAHGMTVVVTPGWRFEARDSAGAVAPAVARLFNGQVSDAGVSYIVRNDYFEPQLGHRADKVIGALRVKCAAGRPTLLETHRFNFIGDKQKVDAAFAELDVMLAQVMVQFPDVGYVSTAALAQIYRDNDSAWLTLDISARLRAFKARCALEGGLWRVMRVSGVALILQLLTAVLPAGNDNKK